MVFLAQLLLSLLTTLLAGAFFTALGADLPETVISFLGNMTDKAAMFPYLFLLLWAGRLSSFPIEFLLLRPYLVNWRKLSPLLYFNIKLFFTLSIPFFLMLPLLKIKWLPIYFKDGMVLILAGLIGLGDAHVNLNFIKSEKLATHIPTVKRRLFCIEVLIYLLLMIAILIFLHAKGK